jgi:hypothetical protein
VELVLTTGEAAAVLGYSEKYVQAKGDNGEIPIRFRTRSGARFFLPKDIEAHKRLLEERARLGKPRRGRPRKNELERRRRQQTLQLADTPTGERAQQIMKEERSA